MNHRSVFLFLSVLTILASTGTASSESEQIAGTAYFITNQPDGNKIIASNIDYDGRLSFASVTYAGGNGSKGISPFAFDSLFSSGSIRVSPSDNVLAVVNAGSKTLSLFEIDEQIPYKLTMIGYPMSSGGDFPISLAFDSKGEQVCVLNGGAINGIMCFGVNKEKGLVPLGDSLRLLNANESTPPSGPFGTLSQLIFNEAGDQLVAAKKGSTTEDQGFLAVWDVDENGNLSPQARILNTKGSGFAPFSLTIIPGKNAFISADGNIGVDVFSLDSETENLETSLYVPNQQAICWSSYSRQTGNYYFNDLLTGMITEVHVNDELNASIVTQYMQKGVASVLDSIVSNINGQDYLYSLSPSTLTIQVYRLNAPGKAEYWQSYNFTTAAENDGAAISGALIAGMAVYLI